MIMNSEKKTRIEAYSYLKANYVISNIYILNLNKIESVKWPFEHEFS